MASRSRKKSSKKKNAKTVKKTRKSTKKRKVKKKTTGSTKVRKSTSIPTVVAEVPISEKAIEIVQLQKEYEKIDRDIKIAMKNVELEEPKSPLSFFRNPLGKPKKR